MLVSVIIPTLDEARHIHRCLDGVLANDVPTTAMEVLVADGRSSDGTREIVRSLAARDPRVFLIDNDRRIQAAGMNAALRVARGRYIVRMDAHVQYPNDYIRTCIEELQRTKAHNVGGCVTTVPGADTSMAHAIAQVLQHPFGVGGSAFRVGWADRYVDTVPFGAFPRSVFDTVGLYDEAMARHEDFELNSRIRRSGGKIFLSARIHSNYIARSTLHSLLSQMYLNGIWNARAWLRYPRTFSPRRAVPPALVLALLLSGVCYPFWPLAGRAGCIALAIYSVGALTVTVHTARGGRRGAFWLPLVFFSMHVTFGAAVLGGLLEALFARLLRGGQLSRKGKVDAQR